MTAFYAHSYDDLYAGASFREVESLLLTEQMFPIWRLTFGVLLKVGRFLRRL